MEKSGRLLSVEGIEGSGKTTHIPFIQSFLEAAGKEVMTSREPGGTPLGETLRGLLLDPACCIQRDTELLLIFAARAEHLARIIRPALGAGKWVVCDRFTDATYAYQGGGRAIPEARIAILEDWVQAALQPHLTLLLDVPVEVGLARIHQRAGPRDRFEAEETAFFLRVREAYLARARREQHRFRVIDARPPVAEVRTQIAAALQSIL
jgi:dTMP kinase